MQLLMHGDSSWSGPGGWWKLHRPLVGIFRLSRRVKKGQNGVGRDAVPKPSALWGLLAFLSLLAFVALPLSGLTMELGDGYGFHGKDHPLATGRDY